MSLFGGNRNKRAQSQSPGGPGGSQTHVKKKDRVSDAVDEDNILEEEETEASQLGNLSKERLAEIASGKTENDGTYASAASKLEVDIKNLVYIQKGHERREPITMPLFLAFMVKLNETIWALPEDEFEKVNIAWSDHALGRGLIASMDPETTVFVKKAAETFNHEGKTIRGWTRDEFGIQIIYQGWLISYHKYIAFDFNETDNYIYFYQGFLHNTLWHDIRGQRAVNMILKKNNLMDAGKYQVISYTKHRKGCFLRFETDARLSKAIDDYGLSLRAGICRLVLKKKVTTPRVVEEKSDDLAGGEAKSSSDTTEKQSSSK